jgi:death-on-curing protein
MDGLVFIAVGDVLEIHRRMIADFGGDPGLRDRGLLESAAAMPRAMFSGEYLHPDVPTMAAAYHFHLCANHPFIDGNKRVAVAVAEIFLRANGCDLNASDEEVVELTLGVAGGTLGKEPVIEFYSKRVCVR